NVIYYSVHHGRWNSTLFLYKSIKRSLLVSSQINQQQFQLTLMLTYHFYNLLWINLLRGRVFWSHQGTS
ncbi:hypothetical protein V1478_008962, partial [Vespula squamosa]